MVRNCSSTSLFLKVVRSQRRVPEDFLVMPHIRIRFIELKHSYYQKNGVTSHDFTYVASTTILVQFLSLASS